MCVKISFWIVAFWGNLTQNHCNLLFLLCVKLLRQVCVKSHFLQLSYCFYLRQVRVASSHIYPLKGIYIYYPPLGGAGVISPHHGEEVPAVKSPTALNSKPNNPARIKP